MSGFAKLLSPKDELRIVVLLLGGFGALQLVHRNVEQQNIINSTSATREEPFVYATCSPPRHIHLYIDCKDRMPADAHCTDMLSSYINISKYITSNVV